MVVYLVPRKPATLVAIMRDFIFDRVMLCHGRRGTRVIRVDANKSTPTSRAIKDTKSDARKKIAKLVGTEDLPTSMASLGPICVLLITASMMMMPSTMTMMKVTMCTIKTTMPTTMTTMIVPATMMGMLMPTMMTMTMSKTFVHVTRMETSIVQTIG